MVKYIMKELEVVQKIGEQKMVVREAMTSAGMRCSSHLYTISQPLLFFSYRLEHESIHKPLRVCRPYS